MRWNATYNSLRPLNQDTKHALSQVHHTGFPMAFLALSFLRTHVDVIYEALEVSLHEALEVSLRAWKKWCGR